MRNDFIERIKVKDEIEEAIEAVEQIYIKHGKTLESKDKERMKEYLKTLNKKHSIEEMKKIEKEEMGYLEER